MTDRQFVYLTTTLAGVVKDEIPFSNISFTGVLNGTSSFTGEVVIDDSDGASPNRITTNNIDVANTLVWVLSDGSPVWGGIIWDVSVDFKGRTLTVQANDLWSYFHRRLVTSDVSFSSQTTQAIATSLITTAQGVTGGDAGMQVSSIGTSPTADRNYSASDLPTIAELVENLAATQKGFDFAMAYSGTMSGGFVSTLELSYPSRGSSKDLVFDTAKNAVITRYNLNGYDLTNSAWAFNSDGESKLTSNAAQPLSGYLLMETPFPHPDVTVQATLDDHAEDDLTATSVAPLFLSLKVDVSDDSIGLGTFDVGDTVVVKANLGYVDIDKEFRIMDFTASVDQNDLDELVVNVADARLF